MNEEDGMSLIMKYIDMCIWQDYMIGILITSASEGKLSSIGMDYGTGKSTLLLEIPYLFVDMYGDRFRENQPQTKQEKWDRVFSYLHTFPWEMEEFYMNAPRRYFGEPVFFLIDDMQMCFGKDRSHDPYIRSLKNRTTRARTVLAAVIASAPDIGELARPWRYFFNFEIKVPQRGKYEVQRLKKWTVFERPYETQARLVYGGESHDHPPLPKNIQQRYNQWRDETDKLYDEGEGEWKLRSIRNVLTDDAKGLVRDLIAKGTLTRQDIITERERGNELKLLHNCGLVEMFGDQVVPTRQARKLIDTL